MTGEHAVRKRLPDERPSITRKVVIDLDVDVYITVGLYPDTMQPGEVFLVVGKVGSTVRGMIDIFGLETSLLLQHGVSLPDLCNKMIGVTFEPRGATNDLDIPQCASVVDYVFRWMKLRFVDRYTPPPASPATDPALVFFPSILQGPTLP